MQHDYYSSNNKHLPTLTAQPVPSAPPLPPTDHEQNPPPPVTSDTYHQNNPTQWALPPGWKTSHRKSDGRIYYWQLSTGRSTWSHPSAPLLEPPASTPFIDLPFFSTAGPKNRAPPTALPSNTERPTAAHRHPDSHQCFALFAAMVFPPLGICAFVHSVLVGKRWREGRYGEAHEHARQAYNYAWWAVTVFVGLVVWRYVVRNGWPDWGGWFD